jgi:uncharacterized protein with PIN domain
MAKRLRITIEYLKNLFIKENYQLLSTKYISAINKLRVICPKGHYTSISYSNFYTGCRCGLCSNNKKLDYSNIVQYIESYGYKTQSTKYINNSEKLLLICPNNHQYKTSWSHFKRGNRCPECSGKRKLTIDEITKSLKKENYQLISSEYINNRQKIQIKCPNDHIFEAPYSSFQSGHRCPECLGLKKYSYDQIKEHIEANRYKLLSDNVKNSKDKFLIECPEKHQYFVSFNLFKNHKTRCPYCGPTMKYTYEDILNEFEKEQYKLLSTEYINCKEKLKVICKNDHHLEITFDSFKSGHRCPHCEHPLIMQNECKAIFEKISNTSFLTSRPKFLKVGSCNYLELDGYCEKLNLAFEFDGPTHSKPIFGPQQLAKQQANDRLKDQLCRKNDIYLIRIPYTVKNKEEFIKNEVDLYNLVGLS